MIRTVALSLALSVAVVIGALAADPAVDAFKARFEPQERVLLAVILADPTVAAQFAADAKSPTDAAISQWRGRLAVGARDYLASPHALNAKARSVQEMVEPGEWSALMVTLKLLADGGIADQAKFRIFLAMIDDADAGLKDGDPTEANKVLKMARPKLSEAMSNYLATDAGKKALADGEAASAEAAAARKRKAEKEAATRKPATVIETPTPSEVKPKPKLEPKPKGAVKQSSALDEARSIEESTRGAETKPIEDAASGGHTFDGVAGSGGAPVVAGGMTTDAPPSAASGLAKSGGGVPTLAVIPPKPTETDDMAELRKMKSKVSGNKKWWAAGGGGLLGALIGFFVGGPIGAVVGAVLGGAAGFFGGKHLWG